MREMKEMRKKRKMLAAVAAALLMLLLLTGCGSKEVITAQDFTAEMGEHGMTVSDLTADYAAEHDYVESILVAQSDEGWQIEFYVLADENYAQSIYNDNKSAFENSKGNVSTEVSKSVGNYSTYSLTSGGVYMHICRVDNTVGFARVDDMYKEEVQELFEEMGY